MELCQNKTSNSLELLSTYLPSALNECVVVGYACYIEYIFETYGWQN